MFKLFAHREVTGYVVHLCLLEVEELVKAVRRKFDPLSIVLDNLFQNSITFGAFSVVLTISSCFEGVSGSPVLV